MRIMLIALLLAVPAACPAADRTEDEAAIARLIKKAESAGFERHQLERHLSAFDGACTWTLGRREEPDGHDVVISRPQYEAQQRQRYLLPTAQQDGIYFNDERTEVTGDTATYGARVRRRFFGGNDEGVRVYQLVRRPELGWQVVAVRTWMTKDRVGGLPIDYTDEFYKGADERLAERLASDATSFEGKIVALIEARQLREAYEAAKLESERVADARVWVARAEMAFEIGKVEDALAAAAHARKLDPACEAPFFARTGR